jgi:hypothetical protein
MSTYHFPFVIEEYTNFDYDRLENEFKINFIDHAINGKTTI